MVKITEALIRKKSEHNECLISTLEELSLHQEDIECIENLHNWCRELKILLLQSNLIAKIENIHKLKKLEYLNLAVNNIERIENLEGLESLNKLDLTLNFIGDLISIESLRDNYNLRELLLIGNPCCDYPHYKQYVIGTLPQLTTLDCNEILPSSKLEAQRHLQDYRAVIVKKQADYFITRDEQKIRVQQQREELAGEMAEINDEDERIKHFWQAKSEHCPESRNDIAKYHKQCREKHEPSSGNQVNKKNRQPLLFAPCGRPYNINQAKLSFNFQDEYDEYILQVEVYKYLDTALIDVDIEPHYVRISIKGKIFQIALQDEVKASESKVQRAQITGHLFIKMPKLNVNEALKPICIDKPKQTKSSNVVAKKGELTGIVDVSRICDEPPELI